MNKYFDIRTLYITLFLLLVIEVVGHIYYYVSRDGQTMWHARSMSQTVQFTPYGLWEYKANAINLLPGYLGVLETDRYGFIHNGRDREISDQDFLIFMLGGSTVEGRGATKNNQTIPAHLEKILRSKISSDRQIVVVNAGFSGHITYQETNVLAGRLLPNYDPEVVVEFGGRNDAHGIAAYADFGWQENWQIAHTRIMEQVQNQIVNTDISGTLNKFLYNYSINYAVAIRVRRRLMEGVGLLHQYPQVELVDEEMIADAADAYIDNQLVMRLRSNRHAADFVAFLQPTLMESQKPKMTAYETSRLEKYRLDSANPENYFHSISLFYELTQQRLVEYPWAFDASSIFSSTGEEIYYDSVHYNDEGNRLIAEFMAQKLIPIINNKLSATVTVSDKRLVTSSTKKYGED